MADRRNYFFGQQVQEGELDAGFDGLERAIWNLAADLGLVGVSSGGVVTQHAPTPDLTVDVTSVRAYDQQGRRIEFPSTQTPNLATDSNSVSTAVVNGGNSKIVSLFVRFKRDQSDPRTDDNAVPLNFVQDEGFEFVIVQGAEAVTPTPPALLSDGILLADITRTFGQTQILNANISTSRRQDMFVGSAGSLSLRAGTPEEAAQALLTLLNNHVTNVGAAHPATALTFTPYANLASTNVQAAIQELNDEAALLAVARTITAQWTIGASAAPTAALLNKLTALNLVKAWGEAVSDGAGGVLAPANGCNVASYALSGDDLRINFAQGFTNGGAFIVVAIDGSDGVPAFYRLQSRDASGAFCTLRCIDTAGVQVALSTVSKRCFWVALGVQ